MKAEKIAEKYLSLWHLNDDRATVYKAYLDLLAKQKDMVLVPIAFKILVTALEEIKKFRKDWSGTADKLQQIAKKALIEIKELNSEKSNV